MRPFHCNFPMRQSPKLDLWLCLGCGAELSGELAEPQRSVRRIEADIERQLYADRPAHRVDELRRSVGAKSLPESEMIGLQAFLNGAKP